MILLIASRCEQDKEREWRYEIYFSQDSSARLIADAKPRSATEEGMIIFAARSRR